MENGTDLLEYFPDVRCRLCGKLIKDSKAASSQSSAGKARFFQLWPGQIVVLFGSIGPNVESIVDTCLLSIY